MTKHVDLASPTLNLKCCGGEDIKSMKVHIWKADSAGKADRVHHLHVRQLHSDQRVGGWRRRSADRDADLQLQRRSPGITRSSFSSAGWQQGQELVQLVAGREQGQLIACFSVSRGVVRRCRFHLKSTSQRFRCLSGSLIENQSSRASRFRCARFPIQSYLIRCAEKSHDSLTPALDWLRMSCSSGSALSLILGRPIFSGSIRLIRNRCGTLTRLLVQTVEKFEPRLAHPRVTIVQFVQTESRLILQVSGTLVMEQLREPVSFRGDGKSSSF